jgi:membrane-bound lytic murein transglycosylase B
MLDDSSAIFRAQLKLLSIVWLLLADPISVVAAPCGNGAGGFDNWLQHFKTQAAGQGIKAATISSALSNVSYDPVVIRLDRSQRSFKLSFEQFYARRVDGALISRGKSLMQRHRATLERIERRFGVPGAVVIAIWGLETNYGADSSGHFSILRSLATLAFDCRRSEFFTGQLLDAVRKRGTPWQPGSVNYSVLAEWNKAEVYQRTISTMATRLAGGS